MPLQSLPPCHGSLGPALTLRQLIWAVQWKPALKLVALWLHFLTQPWMLKYWPLNPHGMMPRLVHLPSLRSARMLPQTLEALLDGGDGGQVPETLTFGNLQENNTLSGEQDTSHKPHYWLRSDIETFSGDRGCRPAEDATCTALRRRRSVVGLRPCLARMRTELDFRQLKKANKILMRPRNQYTLPRIKPVEPIMRSVQNEMIRLGRGKESVCHATSTKHEPWLVAEVVGN